MCVYCCCWVDSSPAGNTVKAFYRKHLLQFELYLTNRTHAAAGSTAAHLKAHTLTQQQHQQQQQQRGVKQEPGSKHEQQEPNQAAGSAAAADGGAAPSSLRVQQQGQGHGSSATAAGRGVKQEQQGQTGWSARQQKLRAAGLLGDGDVQQRPRPRAVTPLGGGSAGGWPKPFP